LMYLFFVISKKMYLFFVETQNCRHVKSDAFS
jgi:hypothetical protein